MSVSPFTGSSPNGDFHEALRAAIAAAKEGLSSSYVSWRLTNIFGQNGGVVDQDDLSVTISASTDHEPSQTP